MEVSRLGVESEPQLLAYTTAIATPGLSCIFDLQYSSQQRQILNPLSEARDRTQILMDASWVHKSLSHNGNAYLGIGRSFTNPSSTSAESEPYLSDESLFCVVKVPSGKTPGSSFKPFSVAGALVLGLCKDCHLPIRCFSQRLWQAEAAASSVASQWPRVSIGLLKLWIWGRDREPCASCPLARVLLPLTSVFSFQI